MAGFERRRRTRRNSFGTVIPTGNSTYPSFAIRWWEGSRRKKQSGFPTRTLVVEALARIRAGLGDGTLVEKRRATIGFDQVARQWLDQDKYARHVHDLARLEPEATASAHGPVLRGAAIDDAFARVCAMAGRDIVPPPGQEMLDDLVAQLTAEP